MQLTIDCRLCQGLANYKFSKFILGKYKVRYYACIKCGSLQTEAPFWLSEAYENSIASMDYGVMQRNISNLATCICLSMIHGYKAFLDFGGGIGILSRLLRDYCINCSPYDLYEKNDYFGGLADAGENFYPDVVSAFEVIEHFSNPGKELDLLFNRGQRCVIVSTILYDDQSSDWWYLSLESGQHVFFYTKQAMRWIAKKYQLDLVFVSEYAIFFSKIGFFKKLLTKILLITKVRRFIRAIIMLLPARGVWNDFHHHPSKLGLNGKSQNKE